MNSDGRVQGGNLTPNVTEQQRNGSGQNPPHEHELRMEAQSTSIHALFEEHTQRYPDSYALRWGTGYLTYAELNRRAESLATSLLAHGVRLEDRVAIMADRCAEMVVGFLGILKAGAAYVPLDPNYPQDRLRFMLRDSCPKVILTQASYAIRLEDYCIPQLMLEEHVRPGSLSNHDLSHPSVSPRNLAYIAYTSGSTGAPKGVMVEHRGVLRLVSMATNIEIGRDDRIAHCASPSFDATTWEVWSALLSGARLVVFPQSIVMNPVEFNEALVSQRISALWLTVGLFNEYVDVLEEAFSSLKYLIIGGDRANPTTVYRALRKKSPPRHLINAYGPTESTTFTTLFHIDVEARANGPIPIGTPIADTRVYILDERHRPVPANSDGEIYIGGSGVARGYLNQPALTAERFLANEVEGGYERIYKSGDVGHFLSDGTIDFVGRIDSQVKVNGFRVEPGEIEAALFLHDAVSEAAVVARDHRARGRCLVAYIVPTASQEGTERGQHRNESKDDLVTAWRDLYDVTYSSSPEAPSFTGWNSSYTGEPIPLDQMQEWLDCTIARIRTLAPRRILEIGCGTGLLLQHLAPDSELYLGIDFSLPVLEKLRGWLNERPEMSRVKLEHRSAIDIEDLPWGTFDTVILNSVIQYFPDVHYLERVLRRAVRLISPSGRIFVGDVRNLQLLRPFHSAVQLHKASPDMPVSALKVQIDRQVSAEKELVVAPAFFSRLGKAVPEIRSVSVLLKRGGASNELTRYRYDAVLHVGPSSGGDVQSAFASPQVEMNWSEAVGGLADLYEMVSSKQYASIAFRNVPNSRLTRDLTAQRLIAESGDQHTINEIRKQLDQSSHGGEDPDAFWNLGDDAGYKTVVSWAPHGDAGRFDIYWFSTSANPPNDSFFDSNSVDESGAPHGDPSVQIANTPWHSTYNKQLGSDIRGFLESKIPEYMMPTEIVVLDKLPLTVNGKIDRNALPDPAIWDRPHENTAGQLSPTELKLTEFWKQVLNIGWIGPRENFFDLGGHSMLAMRLAILVTNWFGIKFPAMSAFKCPTIERMATVVDGMVSDKEWAAHVQSRDASAFQQN